MELEQKLAALARLEEMAERCAKPVEQATPGYI